MSRLDPHSYHDLLQPQISSLHWKAKVDFPRRMLHAEVALHFLTATRKAGPLDLDTRDLEIEAVVELETRHPLAFTLHPPEPVLGSRLEVQIPSGSQGLVIRYRTRPQASALQWLEPAQTQDKKAPFLFSQCQAIHARSIIPIQDTPRVRIRYQAELTVPVSVRGLMAAIAMKRVENQGWATEHYQMEHPIPPYLFAFAVGDLVSKELSSRSRVWAEPSVVDAAAWEFSNIEAMMQEAEKLFGPYDWGRFDILTMPPSFPYGGMENPCLTFVTPTLLAKDRSLVNVLAHELAHSWTGNLVTNANAEHFWLNEGFTVFAERRILEALEGPDMCALHTALGRQALDETLQQFTPTPQWTALRTHLAGVDPDDVFSQVPYEKGFLFLKTFERELGRARFDVFLREYLRHFRFQSITTEDFLDYVEKREPGVLKRVEASAWVSGANLPITVPAVTSSKLQQLKGWVDRVPETDVAARWSQTEWQYFLEACTRPATLAFCEALEQRFHLTQTGNAEILVSALTLGVSASYQPAIDKTREYLGSVGRMKYLKPLYSALLRNVSTRAVASACFESYQRRYHPIARNVIQSLLAKASP